MTSPRLRVLYDGDAFQLHVRSGITRHFTELISAYRTDPAWGIDAITPYKYIANEYLPHRLPESFRQVPLPRRLREPLLTAANRRHRRTVGRPDVVHHSLYDVAQLEEYPDSRHAVMIHDFTLELHGEWFDPEAGRQAIAEKNAYINACDVLLCNSENTRRDLLRLHPDLDTVVAVTPLGVAPEFFTPAPERLPHLPERYLLHVGSRFRHKNVDLLCRAFARLLNRDPELRLVLCGPGAPEEKDRLEELGIARQTMVVRIADRDLPQLYARAAAFVFPSHYEGFGMPVIEAMAAGCPVVISDAPALVEVAGGAADVIGVDDVDALVASVERILGDPETVQRMTREGKARAADFSWRQTAELTAQAYHRAVAG